MDEELKDFAFKCMKCDRQYLYNTNLLKHIRLKHKEDTKDLIPRRKLVCGECKAECMSKLEFETHLRSAHGIVPNVEEYEFASLEECLAFKANIELSTNSRFVKRSANSGKNKTTYYCHRGGYHKSESRGIRPNRSPVTFKINCFCPAQFKILRLESKFKVVLCSTHVGHSDVKTSFLSVDEVSEVAEKLARNVPIEAVFNDIKDKLTEERDRVCNQKDVLAISSQYNVSSSSALNDVDTVSLDLWLEDLKALEPSPVLLYKKKDEVRSDLPQLEADDFMLVLMTDFQADMMAKHGKELVSVGFYPGSNGHNIHLLALSVCDKRRNGCPVCFVVTNRIDTVALAVAFTAFRDKCRVKPAVVITDDEDLFFDSWCLAFGEQRRRLLNLWDVDRRLRGKITQLVADRAEQANVYKLLRTMMVEMDTASFQRQMRNAMEVFGEQERLKRFGEYFAGSYASRYELWSSAYRKRNNVLKMEKVHRTMEFIFVEGGMAKRLDEAVQCLLWYLRDKFLEKRRSRARTLPSLCSVHKGHEAGLEVCPEDVSKSGYSWLVNSKRRVGETFSVSRQQQACKAFCPFQCKECHSCLHSYRCTCADSVVFFSMCAHIHAVCCKIGKEGDQEPSPPAPAADPCADDMEVEAPYVAVEVDRPVTEASLRQDIQHLSADLQRTVDDFQRVATFDELRDMKELLSRTLSSVSSYRDANMVGRSCVVELGPTTLVQTAGMTTLASNAASGPEQTLPSSEEAQSIACWLIYPE